MSALALVVEDETLWVPIEGSPGYEVTEDGLIRNARTGRVLKPAPNSKGYLKVSLGRRRQVYVHHVVMFAFVGPRPSGHVIDHIDFDLTNNARRNLRYLWRPYNDFRWQRHQTECDPEELARIDARYQALVARGEYEGAPAPPEDNWGVRTA